MSETPDLESTADRVVAALRNIDGKVNAKRDQRLNDPDSFGDKIFKFAMPTLVGLAFGKVFEMAWKQSVGRKATLPGNPLWRPLYPVVPATPASSDEAGTRHLASCVHHMVLGIPGMDCAQKTGFTPCLRCAV